jgi:uncharacterized RDD family membrane protein YckC
MTLTMDDYIRDVVGRMPIGAPRLKQIELELRSTINERLEHGQSLDNVLRQLGDPGTLADSYLAEVPLVAGDFWERGRAKLIDLLTIVVALAPVAALVAWRIVPFAGIPVEGFGVAFLFPLYNVICEWKTGQTLGKRYTHLRVVRETGARISPGEAVVRQLPQFLQVFWIDIAFALFTENKQRAFELLSKTRVVVANPADAL